MATSIEWARLLAAATSHSPKTTLVLVRRLGENNLISKGGRGSNAPAMTELDVARMLIALLSSGTTEDMPEAVRVFGSFRMITDAVPKGTGRHTIRPNRADSFEEAIAAIILQLSKTDDLPDIAITVNTNELLCEIVADGLGFTYSHAVLSDMASGKTDDISKFIGIRAAYRAKVLVSRTIKQDVLAEIAKSFRVEEAADANLSA